MSIMFRTYIYVYINNKSVHRLHTPNPILVIIQKLYTINFCVICISFILFCVCWGGGRGLKDAYFHFLFFVEKTLLANLFCQFENVGKYIKYYLIFEFWGFFLTKSSNSRERTKICSFIANKMSKIKQTINGTKY